MPTGRAKTAVFALASAGCAATIFVAEQVYVWRNKGFGAGDLPAFLYWSAPFLAIIGLTAVVFACSQLRPTARHVASVLIGPLLAIAWTLWVARRLGDW